METAEIKDLFIIDGKELQKSIKIHKDLKKAAFEASLWESAQYHQGKVDVLIELQQSLSPLEPLLEKAFNAGSNIPSYEEMTFQECSDAYHWCLKDFLNKPIELK